MTTYDTIPTSLSFVPATKGLTIEYLIHAKEGLGTCCSWQQMLNFHNCSSLPSVAPNFPHRIGGDNSCLTLLIFLRDKPIMIFDRMISDENVLIGLSIITIVLLLLIGATTNVLSSLLVSVVLILIQAFVRKTNDLCIDPEAAGGLLWPPASR
ncbi:PRA1 family protein F2-like [Olea europaea var. sylvestris]|uniref:PRA1 family protein F2-like n=1 Tax=Olea europaea var. sylvestris TaxID=158386 RepID=UPI000C1D2449|nr:PRA1 family protein F2-like [Olea europaea var. sylvestris]